MAGGPSWSNPGRLAASAWLAGQRMTPPGLRWSVEVQLDVRDEVAPADFDTRADTRFHIEIYAEEWGFFFCHAGLASWIRITDIPFIHGRDDHRLLLRTPALDELGEFLRQLEQQHAIQFKREHARVRTTLAGAEASIRGWVQAL